MSGGGFGEVPSGESPLQGLQGLGMTGGIQGAPETTQGAPGALMPETLDRTTTLKDSNELKFQPRFDYMYGGQERSRAQFNPFTMGYYGADPMYGGYSPFIPQLPDYSMYNNTTLSKLGQGKGLSTGDEKEGGEGEKEESKDARTRVVNQFGLAGGGAVYDSGIKSI
jgi:hypothetical protein